MWSEAKLDDIRSDEKGSLVSGPFGSNIGSRFFVEQGIPVIRGNNLTLGEEKFIDSGFVFITEEKAMELKNCNARSGDIIFTAAGTLGQVGLIPTTSEYETYIISNKQIRLRLDTKRCEPLFAYYCLSAPHMRSFIVSQNKGSSVPLLTLGIVRNFKIPLPSLKVQQKIAAILSAYDDLIENNRRRIALLEKMAEELYREWFVRMRFPGHEKVKFVKGVPESWRFDRVDSIGKVVTGKTPSTSNPRYFEGPYLFVKTPDMHGNVFIFETEEELSQDGLSSQSAQTIPEGSICVSCIGTSGIVSITTTKCQTNQQINSVILSDQSDLEWAFFTLRNLREMILMFGATGATMTNLSKGKFSSLKILRPNKSALLEYHALVNPMFVQIQNILQQTKNLMHSRDLLLPRLISGKLSVENLDIRFPPSMEEAAHA